MAVQALYRAEMDGAPHGLMRPSHLEDALINVHTSTEDSNQSIPCASIAG